MPEFVSGVLETPGLVWLILTISGAGIIRGFTGFGTALIFVPVAGMFLPPTKVVAVITLTGVASTAALLPRAWGRAARGEVGLLVGAALLTVPAGIWLLTRLDAVTVRWIVIGLAAATLLALVSGWRYGGTVKLPGLGGIGAAAGIVGGLTGLTGPVVILFYLAGHQGAQAVRANTILFLAALDVVIVANLLWQGAVGADTLLLAVLLSVPYFFTTLVGQALFDPALERPYRWVAYAVIALAVLSGLPLWD